MDRRLFQLDLSGGNAWQALFTCFENAWKFHGFGLPALVEQSSRKWRFPADLSHETVFIRRVSCRYRDSRSLLRLRDGSDFEMLKQNLPAAMVDNPSCCSDLFVIVRSDVFHEEIHEAPFLLEETDDA